MPQKTNAAAYNQLQPTKSNNIGNIVQENIRFWRKYEDEKTAKEKIEKAREAEFQFKIDGKVDNLYEAFRPTDPIGVYNAKLVEAFEKDQDRLYELSDRAAKGGAADKTKYNNELTKWKNAMSRGAALKEKITSNAEARKNGSFNSVLDGGVFDVEKPLVSGAYNIDPITLNMKTIAADGTEGEFNQDTLSQYLSYQLGTPAKFQGAENPYSSALTEQVYGRNPNITDEEARVKGIQEVYKIFSTDPNEKVTWYGTYMQENGIDPKTADKFEDLNDLDKSKIAEAYFREESPKPIPKEKTTKERLDEAKLTGQYLSNTEQRLQNEQLQEAIDNPPPKTDKTSDAKKKRDYTRTLVDGVKAGDESFIQMLVKLQPSTKGQGFIKEASYSNGILEYRYIRDEDNDSDAIDEIKTIDTRKEGSEAKILSLFYPKTDPANSMYNYKFGETLEDFDENTNTGLSKVKSDAIQRIVTVGANDKKVASALKDIGIDVKAVGNVRNVIEYKGVEYKIGDEEGVTNLLNKISEVEGGSSNNNTHQQQEGKKETNEERKKRLGLK